jgi:uncharacterized protein
MGITVTNNVPPPSVDPSILHRIFVGKQGIRAGWSIGIFLILVALLTSAFILPTKYVLEKANLPITDEEALQVCIGEFAVFLGLLGASMTMAFIEHKPLISYGLEGRRRFARFSYGALSGVIALTVLVCALKFWGFLLFDGQPVLGWSAIEYAFAWGGGFFLIGLYEEYLFRGYLQATLTRGMGFWWSALLLSLAFGSSHIFNKGESPVGIVSAALLGMLFCISLWYLKQLWWAIGFHASWNWGQSYFWGTANSGKVVHGHLFSVHPQGNILLSGGATGPEGSLMVIPLLLLIALLMWMVWRRSTAQQSNNGGARMTSLP